MTKFTTILDNKSIGLLCVLHHPQCSDIDAKRARGVNLVEGFRGGSQLLAPELTGRGRRPETTGRGTGKLDGRLATASYSC